MSDGKVDVTNASKNKGLDQLKLALDTLGIIRAGEYDQVTKEGLAAASQYVIDKSFLERSASRSSEFEIARLNANRMYETNHINAVAGKYREWRANEGEPEEPTETMIPEELFPDYQNLYDSLLRSQVSIRDVGDILGRKYHLRHPVLWDITGNVETAIKDFHRNKINEQTTTPSHGLAKSVLEKGLDFSPTKEPPIGRESADKGREQE
ncbi:hypothetical protein SAMN05444392_106101 [Seinonella peptonophila]|uniref:Uncharacterized protein n=1 Tax=Seinonella peptonophila TaxID=112248 RepID=A0A1M4Y814_9BACL|nr:hypothetical protein [Seinonella peptonophila]SHF01947.1 hypothetical protein SAMN05444392_106101 [Seinonella peptonophila]